MKKLILFIFVLLMLIPAVLAEETATPEGTFAAENERLALYVAEDVAGINVLDKATGRIWSSSMNDETFAGEKVNAAWQKRMNSMLSLNYTNLSGGLGSINSMALLADKQYAGSYELVENGVKLHYTFGSCGIDVDVIVTLEGDTMLVSIPYSSIQENDVFSVVSFDVMPFFFSATDKADGYFLYPDGCGAIMEFQDNAHQNEKTQVYTVYGALEKHEALKDFFDPASPVVMLPVYGMKWGDTGAIAVVEKGDETSRVSINCSSKIVKANYLFGNFQYRRGFDDLRVTDRSFKIYDRKAIETDYAVRVIFLPEGESDYSAMACAYRDYLLERGILTEGENVTGVAVDIFLTTNEEGLLIDEPRTVTTLNQAEEMLTAFHDAGIQSLHVALKGWNRNGYGAVPNRFPLGRSVGKEKDLKSLTASAAQYGYDVSLTANFIEAAEDEGGYSRRNDVVYTGNYAILTNKEEDLYILSPDVIQDKYEEFAKKAADLGLSGVRFENMGTTLGFNYYSRRYFTAAECVEIYNEMMADARQSFGMASVQGGAQYAVRQAAILTEIPMEDYGFQLTTGHVPFYQMVMHGLRAYTGQPGNLSSDLEREVLRWVEMGYMPYFELTYGGTEDLMYTDYQKLFSARVEDWLPEVRKVAQQFETGDLARIQSLKMLKHEQIAADVFRVAYEEGYVVYVNYREESVKADGIDIPARDYVIVKEASK